VKHAHAGFGGEFCEFEWLAVRLVQKATDALHEIDLRIKDARASRLATQARAKAGLFRGLGEIEKLNALAMRATRRT
jgi:hypothetical protein